MIDEQIKELVGLVEVRQVCHGSIASTLIRAKTCLVASWYLFCWLPPHSLGKLQMPKQVVQRKRAPRRKEDMDTRCTCARFKSM